MNFFFTLVFHNLFQILNKFLLSHSLFSIEEACLAKLLIFLFDFRFPLEELMKGKYLEKRVTLNEELKRSVIKRCRSSFQLAKGYHEFSLYSNFWARLFVLIDLYFLLFRSALLFFFTCCYFVNTQCTVSRLRSRLVSSFAPVLKNERQWKHHRRSFYWLSVRCERGWTIYPSVMMVCQWGC